MAFLEFENTIQVNAVGLLHGQSVENTMFFWRTSGAWTEADATVFLEDLQTWWADGVKTKQSTDYTLVEFIARDLTDQYSWSIAHGVGLTGEVASDALPTTDALVMTFRTNQVGRAFRGRNYIAGIPKANVENSVFDPVLRASFVTYYNNLLVVPTTYSALMVVASRQLNNVPRTTGHKTVVTSFTAQANPGTMRKRRVGSGS